MFAASFRSSGARAVSILVLFATATFGPLSHAAAETRACEATGAWLDPATGQSIAHAELVASAARHGVVLLGETHDDAEHHRWQLSMLAGLYAYESDLRVGFEAFPRRVQPVLDSWVAGELGATAFIKTSDWDTVWAFDPSLYMPLFDFVRMHHLPMVALNVERALVTAVGKDGWAAIAAAAREGVGTPAPASASYRRELAEVYRQHQAARAGHGGEKDLPDVEVVLSDPAFERFVEAQLTWDRAMAEAIAKARGHESAPTVVGIVGSGHLRRGHGIPWQLAALGIDDVMVLLPVASGEACKTAEADIADALFVTADRREPAPPRARLGVYVGTVDEGVRISRVVEDTVAARAGLVAGDLVVEAAGVALTEHPELIALVQRQAPGTWLPMIIERDGERIDVIAKFPVSFK